MSVGISYYSDICPCLPLSNACRYVLLFWYMPLSAFAWGLSVCLIILMPALVWPGLMSLGVSYYSDVCPCLPLSDVCRYILFWCMPSSALVWSLSVYLIILLYALVWYLSVYLIILMYALVWCISVYLSILMYSLVSCLSVYLIILIYALFWCLSEYLVILMHALVCPWLMSVDISYYSDVCPCLALSNVCRYILLFWCMPLSALVW